MPNQFESILARGLEQLSGIGGGHRVVHTYLFTLQRWVSLDAGTRFDAVWHRSGDFVGAVHFYKTARRTSAARAGERTDLEQYAVNDNCQ